MYLRYIYLLRSSPVPIEILEPRVIYGDHYYFAFTTLPCYKYSRAIRARAKKENLENLYGVLLKLIRRAAPRFDNKGILLGTYYAPVMRSIRNNLQNVSTAFSSVMHAHARTHVRTYVRTCVRACVRAYTTPAKIIRVSRGRENGFV